MFWLILAEQFAILKNFLTRNLSLILSGDLMNIESMHLKLADINIPIIKIYHSDSSSNVIVLHGIGGNKEEQLGLSWRISSLGFNTYTVDLRGHGENTLPLSIDILNDINLLADYLLGNNKPVIAVGHSLGGRLALLSKADIRIGISPALGKTFSDQTKTAIDTFRNYRVLENVPNSVFNIFAELPDAVKSFCKKDLVVYGSRDVSDIKYDCEIIAANFANTVRIENAFHNDIFLLEATFNAVERHLKSIMNS
jgi:esterase/lipase